LLALRELRGNTFDPDEFSCGKEHEKETARLAPAIDVDPVVGLLFSHVLRGFMFAGGHQAGPGGDTIYAFSGRRGWRDPA